MRYCSNCGTQNEADAKFCAGCGAQLEAAAPAEVVSDAAPAAPEFVQQPQAAYQQPQQAYQPPQDTYQQPQQGYVPPQGYQQPQQNYQDPQGFQPYQNRIEPTGEVSSKCRTFGIIGFILGILSTAFCWLGILPYAGIFLGFFMLAFGIVGLIFTGISRKNGVFKLANVGKVFAIIGIVLSAICWVIGIILSAAGAYYYY